jgi:predicted ArsR family transcriptional regulator
MPDRQYDLAGRLLADAVAQSSATGAPIDECLHHAARDAGRAMGAQARSATADATDDATATVVAALERHGYRPTMLTTGEIALANCPFHRLAEQHRTMVCGMNLDFLSGLVEALDPERPHRVQLIPEPGYCCVRLTQP